MTINSASYQLAAQDAADCPMIHLGYRYDPQPYDDSDTYTQIWHEAVGPDGQRVKLDHSSYRELDEPDFQRLIERLAL